MKKVVKRRLLSSKLITKYEKSILFELLTKNSKIYNDELIAEENFSKYFTELYIKYLIPKDLIKLEKKCSCEFVYKLSGIGISGSELFDMDPYYIPDYYTKDNFSISTVQSFKFKKPLIDIRYLYIKDNDKICDFNIGKTLIDKLDKKEKKLLRNLYCDFIENTWKKNNYLREYRGSCEFFPNISTWDSLYTLNPEWYDLLYNYLTYYNSDKFNDCDLFSETVYDREINDSKSIDELMKKVINFINE